MNGYVEVLNSVIGGLRSISTKGEDTLMMADCIRALAQVVNAMSVQPEEESEECVTEIVEE